MSRRLTARAILLGLAAGCGEGEPELPSVTGTVLYQGKPAAGALVIFNPVSGEEGSLKRPSAKVADDGTFNLSTRGAADGAPPGDYLVTVLWLEGGAKSEGEMGLGTSPKLKAGGADRLGGRYAHPDRSGLKATIVEGENRLPPFDLE